MKQEQDMTEWKKQFETTKSKAELEFRLKEVRRLLIDLSEAMTKLMSEEEHIGIQLKLKSVQEKREDKDGDS
jgi:hypothetical protein